METSGSKSDIEQRLSRLMILLIIQMILLVLQFVTGIIENKYPFVLTFALLGIPFLTLELLIHVVAGFAIVIIGIWMLYQSSRVHSRALIIMNLISPIFTGLAIHAGAVYFLYTYDPAYSVWMAVCYIIVFVVYCLQAHRLALMRKLPAEKSTK